MLINLNLEPVVHCIKRVHTKAKNSVMYFDMDDAHFDVQQYKRTVNDLVFSIGLVY